MTQESFESKLDTTLPLNLPRGSLSQAGVGQRTKMMTKQMALELLEGQNHSILLSMSSSKSLKHTISTASSP